MPLCISRMRHFFRNEFQDGQQLRVINAALNGSVDNDIRDFQAIWNLGNFEICIHIKFSSIRRVTFYDSRGEKTYISSKKHWFKLFECHSIVPGLSSTTILVQACSKRHT